MWWGHKSAVKKQYSEAIQLPVIIFKPDLVLLSQIKDFMRGQMMLGCFRRRWPHSLDTDIRSEQTSRPPSLPSDVWGGQRGCTGSRGHIHKREGCEQFNISTRAYFSDGDDRRKGNCVKLSFYWPEGLFSYLRQQSCFITRRCDWINIWRDLCAVYRSVYVRNNILQNHLSRVGNIFCVVLMALII